MGELITGILTDANLRTASGIEKARLKEGPGGATPWL